MREFTVNKNDSGQRLDKFISKTVRDLPLSLVYKYIRKKRIKVNGKKSDGSYKLCEGDFIEMYIPDEFFSEKTDTSELYRTEVKPDIVFEDDNLIIVSKKPGILVHTGDEGDKVKGEEAERGTLVFAVKSYLYKKGEYDPENENSFAPALCNRIDRNTGGIVIAAKNAEYLRAVNEAIRERKIVKKYLCAVHGKMKDKTGRLVDYLTKDEKSRSVSVSSQRRKGSRTASLSYKEVRYNREKDLSLLEVTLETGRTHQIRAQLANAGHPLLGDGKYGHNRDDRKMGYKYQALYAYSVKFISDSPELSYLYDREFRVDRDDIFFLELF